MGRLSEIIETAIGRNKETWAAQSAYKDAVIQAALLTPEADWTRPVLWKELPQFLGAHPESHFDYMENTWNYLDSLAKWTKKAREQHAAQPWPSNYAGDAARAADTVISERCFRVAARTSLSGGSDMLRAVKKAGKDRLPVNLDAMIAYMKIKPVKSGDL